MFSSFINHAYMLKSFSIFQNEIIKNEKNYFNLIPENFVNYCNLIIKNVMLCSKEQKVMTSNLAK